LKQTGRQLLVGRTSTSEEICQKRSIGSGRLKCVNALFGRLGMPFQWGLCARSLANALTQSLEKERERDRRAGGFPIHWSAAWSLVQSCNSEWALPVVGHQAGPHPKGPLQVVGRSSSALLLCALCFVLCAVYCVRPNIVLCCTQSAAHSLQWPLNTVSLRHTLSPHWNALLLITHHQSEAAACLLAPLFSSTSLRLTQPLSSRARQPAQFSVHFCGRPILWVDFISNRLYGNISLTGTGPSQPVSSRQAKWLQIEPPKWPSLLDCST